MTNLLLGIDPGRKGALAILDAEEMHVEVHDMPQTPQELYALFESLPKIKMCILEKLHAGPQMSRTAIARMFEDYGLLKGALIWRDVPFFDVRPAKWKPALNVTADKSSSRQMAMQLWPDQASLFKRVKDDGRAEAALLAWYGSTRRTKHE